MEGGGEVGEVGSGVRLCRDRLMLGTVPKPSALPPINCFPAACAASMFWAGGCAGQLLLANSTLENPSEVEYSVLCMY